MEITEEQQKLLQDMTGITDREMVNVVMSCRGATDWTLLNKAVRKMVHALLNRDGGRFGILKEEPSVATYLDLKRSEFPEIRANRLPTPPDQNAVQADASASSVHGAQNPVDPNVKDH